MNKSIVRAVTGALLGAALLLSGCQLGNGANGRLEASGTIEAEEIRVSPEVGGKLVELTADKGDRVEAGQVLARLDTSLLEAQRDQAGGAAAQAQAALEVVKGQLAKARAGARPEELASARSGLASAEAGLEAAIALRDSAQANLAAAQGQAEAAKAAEGASSAGVDAARASLQRATTGATAEEIAVAERTVEAAKNALWGVQSQRDAVCGQVGRSARESDCDSAKAAVQSAEEQVRIAELKLEQIRKGARSEDIAALQAQVSQAKAGVETNRANAATAQARVDAAQAALAQAEANVKAAQAQRDHAQASLDLVIAGARDEDIAILEAQVRQAEAATTSAQAALRAVETQISRMTLAAPASGVVVARTAHVGELVAAGSSLYVVSDLGRLTLTVYVPETDLGKVALGQAVEVSVDAYKQAFTGQVTYIASSAEFTPRNVQTKEERVNMVFAVDITLDDAEGKLLPGMPADVVFLPSK